jgi:hypothetical protein
MQPVAGTMLYDIANRQGELFDRIRTPSARTIVGFAPGGIVYTAIRQGVALKLERVRWR